VKLFLHLKRYFFQEWITKKNIGEGFLENELYILQEEKDTICIKKKKN
jgi:hypothetical protein